MLLILIILLKLLNAISETHADDPVYQPLWRYDAQHKWPGQRCQIGGRRQSPININTSRVIEDMHRLFIKHGPLVFKGYKGVLVTGTNNGHTIQFTTEGDESMHPLVSGGPLNSYYRLEQLHFHWTSEHAIDGVKFPMEIHFVHVRYGLSVAEALARRDGLAILSVFCKVISDLDDSPEGTKQLMSYIPRLRNTGDRISGVFLDLRKWLSPNTNRYYTYSGSLTSPQCNEAVTWIIFPAPIILTNMQYQLISTVGFGGPNSRSLQKISRHVVYTPPKTKIRIPTFVTFSKSLYTNVTELVKDITNTLVTGIKSQDRIK